MDGTPRTRTRSDLTLILAAERLLAERGMTGASLREINQAANHRNISAAHYHFGSREGLIAAVLEYRLPPLDRRRGALLRRQSASRDLRFYVSAFVEPLAEELAPREEGNHFIRFMQQYERSVNTYEAVQRLTPEAGTIYEAIGELIGYLPAPVRRMRIRYLINIIHSVLASAEGRLLTGAMAHADVALTSANLVDLVVGGLCAPLSPETIGLLADQPG